LESKVKMIEMKRSGVNIKYTIVGGGREIRGTIQGIFAQVGVAEKADTLRDEGSRVHKG
jgi:hypothetical protein